MELNWDNFSDLDSSTKYCLVDTSALLPIFCNDINVIRDVRRHFGGAILVLLKPIISETFYKYREWENGHEDCLDAFVSRLSDQLGSSRMSFRLSRFDYEMNIRLSKMIRDDIHSGLSNVDYALLCAAMERPDMDVMTGDKSLIGSICNENPQARGRVYSVLYNHNKRRVVTAAFIKRKIVKNFTTDADIDCQYRYGRTEFLVGGKVAASIHHPRGEKHRVDLSRQVWGKRADAELIKKEILKRFSEEKSKQGGRGPRRKEDVYRLNRNDGYDWADDVKWRSSWKRKR
ncbi:MAG: hypothetical protein OXI27_07455 [Thaumarchaeota archaeon]|nr:hypothetical protein [Nitrososphaerota archaeon]